MRFSDIDTHVPHPSDLGSSPTFQKSKVAKKNSLLSKTFNAPVSMAETSPATTDTEDTTSGEEDEDIEVDPDHANQEAAIAIAQYGNQSRF